MPVETWVIVVAAGEGRRFGARKQFASLQGRPVVAWALDAARSVATGIVLVAPRDDAPGSLGGDVRGADAVVAGGATRADSVRAGLAAVPVSADIVVVHDAARPLASPELFRAVVDAVVAGADGAIPGIPVADTVKRVAGATVVETLERSDLVAVQTPQAFRASVLRRAHDDAADATDDAGLLERIGARVTVVTGELTNVKLTGAADLQLLESFLEAAPAGRATHSGAGRASPVAPT